MESVDRNGMEELARNFQVFHYVSPEDFPQFFDSFTEEVQEVAWKIKESETGAILMENSEKNLLVIPPFPVDKTYRGDGSGLLGMIGKRMKLGIILLRLGEYSLGFFDGNELKSHKTGTQFVSGQTRAGGQSAARYGRIREGQINDFFKTVCFHVKEKILPLGPDCVFFGGDSNVSKSFMKKCACLEKFRVMGRALNVRHMKMESLKDSLKEVWKFRVYEISRK